VASLLLRSSPNTSTFEEFDPRRDYALTVRAAELTEIERNAASADEVELEL
jgi:hypothetical protein